MVSVTEWKTVFDVCFYSTYYVNLYKYIEKTFVFISSLIPL